MDDETAIAVANAHLFARLAANATGLRTNAWHKTNEPDGVARVYFGACGYVTIDSNCGLRDYDRTGEPTLDRFGPRIMGQLSEAYGRMRIIRGLAPITECPLLD